jgi:transcriptional regulator with XRE-family HTH domain
MTSYLQQKLKSLIESKNTNIASLEKSAGIKRDAIRNILSGRSKSPSLGLISSIAKALDANIADFIDSDYTSQSDITSVFILEKLEWNKDLIQDTINTVQLLIDKYSLSVDFDKAIKFVREIYAYSLGKNLLTKKADADFAEWLVKSTLKR